MAQCYRLTDFFPKVSEFNKKSNSITFESLPFFESFQKIWNSQTADVTMLFNQSILMVHKSMLISFSTYFDSYFRLNPDSNEVILESDQKEYEIFVKMM